MKDEQTSSETISALIKSSCNMNWNGGHDFSSDESILEKQNIPILEALLYNQNIMACKLYKELVNHSSTITFLPHTSRGARTDNSCS